MIIIINTNENDYDDDNDDDDNSNNNNNNKNNSNDNENFSNFTWFLFLNKRIYNFSSTITVILSVVGHNTRDVRISFHQFKSSGFSSSLLRMQNK